MSLVRRDLELAEKVDGGETPKGANQNEIDNEQIILGQSRVEKA
jgi:hypothetical protein